MKDKFHHASRPVFFHHAQGAAPFNDCSQFATKLKSPGFAVLSDVAGDAQFVAFDHVPSKQSRLVLAHAGGIAPLTKFFQVIRQSREHLLKVSRGEKAFAFVAFLAKALDRRDAGKMPTRQGEFVGLLQKLRRAVDRRRAVAGGQPALDIFFNLFGCQMGRARRAKISLYPF